MQLDRYWNQEDVAKQCGSGVLHDCFWDQESRSQIIHKSALCQAQHTPTYSLLTCSASCNWPFPHHPMLVQDSSVSLPMIKPLNRTTSLACISMQVLIWLSSTESWDEHPKFADTQLHSSDLIFPSLNK